LKGKKPTLDIRILGAHSSESLESYCNCFIVDNTLAVEAGALTSRLSIEEQKAIDAVILSHQHIDHIRDIPSIAINYCRFGSNFDVYSSSEVNNVIQTHLLNGVVYPEFHKIPKNKPTVNFMDIEPYGLQWIDGHSILPVPVNHVVPAVGYQISDKLGHTLFYTGDTGPGLAECWRHISPRLLIIDVTVSDSSVEFASRTGHLTPCLLENELISFREIKGYLPEVLAIHMDAAQEPAIKAELAAVAGNLNAAINTAREGMRLLI
jgi:ribonuclease BN (tRNA processing enzyme)